MSHFVAMVIGDDYEKQLAPFHEFECTGRDDECVRDIDRTEEARDTYEKDATTLMIRLPDGTMTSPFTKEGNWKKRFLREPDAEEAKVVGIGSGSATTASGRRVQFVSRDFKDGRGFRTLVVAYPEGSEEVRVPSKDYESFLDWVQDYYGWKTVPHGVEPDLAKAHKYGYIQLDADGNVEKCIDRTNPDKKWDWYQVGGRWTGVLTLKPNGVGLHGRPGLMTPRAGNGTADQAMKKDIDWQGMYDRHAAKGGNLYDRVHAVLDQHPPVTPWPETRDRHPNDIEAARKERGAQPGVVAVRQSTDNDVSWVAFDGLEDYLQPRDVFVRYYALRCVTPFALVHEGKWYEKGRMGWWGMVSNEKDADAWVDHVQELLAGLPDETLLTIVDCHI